MSGENLDEWVKRMPLLPCPFCGFPPRVRREDERPFLVRIECARKGCVGVRLRRKTYLEARAPWNRRSPHALSLDHDANDG